MLEMIELEDLVLALWEARVERRCCPNLDAQRVQERYTTLTIHWVTN